MYIKPNSRKEILKLMRMAIFIYLNYEYLHRTEKLAFKFYEDIFILLFKFESKYLDNNSEC